MRIAVAIDGTRVSTVFDFTEKLVLVEVEGGAITGIREIHFPEKIVSLRVARLKNLKVDTLICGAISEPAAMMIRHCGIRLVQGISGEIENVVEAFIKGIIENSRFFLPGFGHPSGEMHK
ncbi:MAG: NifB/NifX family molybdenum-iron cluster-binding protein [Chitinispirillaceae bacterium]|nr:NifB/NifX family molybdenum-iron cluster-binding protein [Chitinispirillaceae bacterium]